MTVSNELLSSTLHSIRKPAVDALFRSTPILDQMKKLGGYDVGRHGPKIVIPTMVTSHATPTAFPTGSERANQSVQDVMRPMEFLPADLGTPLFIARKVEEENDGDGVIVRIAETRFRAALGGQKRAVNEQILAGSSAVANTAGLATLYGHSAVTSNGYLEGRTAQTNTVGGIAKNLGPVGLLNQWADAADTFGVSGTDAMASIVLGCNTIGEYGEPNLVIAKPAAFRNYKKTLYPNERFGQGDKLDAGRLDLMYGEAVIKPDPLMPDNVTNDFEASMYFLNTEGLKIAVWQGNEFDLGDWFNVANGEQVGRMAWLYTKLQLVLISAASLGFLSDGNTNA